MLRCFIFLFLFCFCFKACEDSSDLPLNNVDLSTNSKDFISLENTSQIAPHKTPSDIESFGEKYKKFIESKSKKDKNLAKNLDKEFLLLRKKYKSNKDAINDLQNYACIAKDCSAVIKNNEYFYATDSILEAINSILMDKNTRILSEINLLKKYEYVIQTKQTTTINLATLNHANSEFSHIKFEWLDTMESNVDFRADSSNLDSKHSPNTLIITLSPKENICAPQQYNIITTFSLVKNVDNSNTNFLSPKYSVKTSHYKEKLPTFLYPADLVLFVRESCACAMAMDNLKKINVTNSNNVEVNSFDIKADSNANINELSFTSNIDSKMIESLPKDYYKFLPPNIKYCENLETKRAILWDKYMQDSKAIKILQTEQKLYE